MAWLKSLVDNPDDLNALVVKRSTQLGKTDNVAATTLYAVPGNTDGSQLYAVTATGVVTTAAGTSSTLPAINLIYTDVTTGTALTLLIAATNTGNAVGTFNTGAAVVNCKGGTNLQFSTTSYASVAANAMTYNVYIEVRRV